MLQSVAYLVGVGKTHLATALGHIAVRRRRTVHMARADKLFKRLTAARLDNTLDYEYRRLTTVELLIIDLSGVLSHPSVTSPAWAWTAVSPRRRVVIQGPTPTSATSA